MGAMWRQQVFALDAKYNSYRALDQPNLRTLYIRRRCQLLRENFPKESEIHMNYLKIRSQLLQRRYGNIAEQSCTSASSRSRSTSIRSCSISRLSEQEFKMNASNSGFQSPLMNEMGRKQTAFQARRSIAENYAFVGVHHIFDQHSAAVSMLKFANNDRSKLCCASLDGIISICEVTGVTGTPPKVVALLKGHQKGVTAIDWSVSNDLVVSCSLDASVRLWSVQYTSLDPGTFESDPLKATCLRVVKDQLCAAILCCAFLPANNNLVITGNSHGLLQVLNVSTGIYPREGTAKIGGKILSLACEESGGGSLVWAGNDRGSVISCQLEVGSGRLTKLRRIDGIGGGITSLSWRSWLSKESPWPTLLLNSACNSLCLYRIIDHHGTLSLVRKYPVRHRQYLVRSTFCPQMGACLIATGSEDGAIHLIDSSREGRGARVNRLQGHAAPTLALSFNYDESLLATADHQGLIIVWRNHQHHHQ
ncbi:WD repeat-containing protein 13-like isoform X1 [Neodiprion virginianus]|uniref:WD repeat-containing protein 13-like isoform X1 n=2 Tax=Neodiprion virginianus TaxID=2961670 RepID=UPI001EE7598E|nr:WD repeat-containing protein 13-like isoform X1 [Neodiprion virginianus]